MKDQEPKKIGRPKKFTSDSVPVSVRLSTEQFDALTKAFGKASVGILAAVSQMFPVESTPKETRGVEGTCPRCGNQCDDITTEADPYASEIAGDETPVTQCKECRYQSAMDI